MPTLSAAISYSLSECSLGLILAAKTTEGLCAVLLADTETALEGELRTRFPRRICVRDDDALASTMEVLLPWVKATHLPCTLPLAPEGTPFQQRVWRALQGVAAGDTTTYMSIAQRLGQPGSVRAVAGAIAANPLALLVPCHRVVRSDGQLAGYRWGLERKRMLLEREAASCAFSLRA